MNFIISMLLGVIPDVLYYFLCIKGIKNINSKNVLFFVLLTIFYVISNVLVTYNFYVYILYDILIYLAMKLLYKSKINDFFVVIILDLYLAICSALSYISFQNYYIAFAVYRVILFIPLIFKNKLRKLYLTYSSLWNRHKQDKKIKSITIRNIAIATLHFMIIIFYIILSYMLNYVG